jgi:hypothetical protein
MLSLLKCYGQHISENVKRVIYIYGAYMHILSGRTVKVIKYYLNIGLHIHYIIFIKYKCSTHICT